MPRGTRGRRRGHSTDSKCKRWDRNWRRACSPVLDVVHDSRALRVCRQSTDFEFVDECVIDEQHRVCGEELRTSHQAPIDSQNGVITKETCTVQAIKCITGDQVLPAVPSALGLNNSHFKFCQYPWVPWRLWPLISILVKCGDDYIENLNVYSIYE